MENTFKSLIEKINKLNHEKNNINTCLNIMETGSHFQGSQNIIKELNSRKTEINNEVETALKEELQRLEQKKNDLESCLIIMEKGSSFHGANTVITELEMRKSEIDNEIEITNSELEKI